ncbi:organic cation transporter protein-like [Branchiostoma lanceolatum]|uniref:organic cation transporter protein-like n=1 Tax=Branchiostoma lanceolatum TaxID=7740 RepID=UPI003455E5AC
MAENENTAEEALVFQNGRPVEGKDDVPVRVNYDRAMDFLGGFGPWQKRVFYLVCLPIGFNAFHVFGTVFMAFEPGFHCRVPQARFSGLNATPAELLNVTIPWELKDEEWKRSQCKRYSYNSSNADANYGDFVEAHPVANRTTIPCDRGYEYDTSEYKSTVTIDWDLVCDNSWKVSLAESLWFAGVMVGAVVGGHAADRWGRKPTLLVSLAVCYLVGIICAFSPNYATFMTCRLIIAACTMASGIVAFVMVTELVSPDKRGFVGMVIWIYWAVGYVIFAGIAYFIRTWMWLQIAITMPYLFFISFWWLIPESPRWLISRNRHEEAAAILLDAAKVAKVTIPDEVFHDEIPLTQTEEKAKKNEKLYTFIDLFRTPNLRKWTINIFFNWIVNTFVYYGISLNTAALSGNLYLNFAISGFIEIPAYLISIVILDKYVAVFFCVFVCLFVSIGLKKEACTDVYICCRFGRRWPLCLMLLFGGVACIVAFFIPKHLGWMTTTLAMTGKFMITASFAVIYVFSAEIFPTVVRQIGIGMSSMSARVGGMVAPFVNLLGSYWAPMPYVIFGGVSIAAGLLALLLPETVGKELPSTIEEAENIGKKDAIVDEE